MSVGVSESESVFEFVFEGGDGACVLGPRLDGPDRALDTFHEPPETASRWPRIEHAALPRTRTRTRTRTRSRARLWRYIPACELALALALLAVLLPATAHARRGVRPLFEPTDLELEKTGVVDIDVQIGAIQGQGPARVVVPDFEVDVGLLPNLELDIDGAYAIEGPASGPFSFDHAAPDSLWVGGKLGIYDWTDDEAHQSWALGLQLGPKLPVASGAHGIGGEVLALIGHTRGKTHLVLNAGAFADPHPAPDTGRPIGIELGLDLDRDLDAAGHFSLTAELSGVRFLSSDPAQLLATAGITYSVNDNLDLSLVGLVGFLDGSDRYGALIGVSPKIHFLGH